MILIVIMIIVFAFAFSSIEPCCTTNKNFELEFLEKLKDVVFLEQLENNPKDVLEEELSKYTGRPFAFNDNVKVKLIHENEDTLYLLIPQDEPLPVSGSPLEKVLGTLNEPETYGLFMSNLNGMWWRLGLHNGSCIKDINNEIQMVENRKCLIC